ncbi:MAG: phage tail tube protein [Gammaproteobacteria bacterium]|nr:phage tail tube protein [Gammaproteobacteria bacterium]
MAFATGAQTSLAVIAETVWGTTPATPELTSFPVTGFNIRDSKDVYESKDIRSDRQITDVRHGFRSPLLDLDFEVKHNNFDWLLSGALFGPITWPANVLKGGTTRNSFTIEAKYGDVTQFMRATGFMVKTLGVKVGTDGIVTGKAGLIGKAFTLAATTVDNSGAYTASTAKSSMSAFQAALTEGGSAIASVTSLDFNIDNGLDPAKVVGLAYAANIFDGRQKVTGTLNAFFEDAVLYNKFLNETASALVLTLTDPAAATLTITLPNIKYTAGDSAVDGESGIVLNLPFTALYDATEATSIKIVRS